MKKSKLIVYLLVVVLGVSVIDVSTRLVLTSFFENPSQNTKAGQTYRFASFKKPANIVILGASRATHHYNSKQIEDRLGVPVYNYGGDGRCSLYQYLCLLKAYDNGDLNTVILDLSEAQLSKEWVEDRISDLYPFYWNNDTIKTMVDAVSGKEMRVLLLSALVQYNSQYLNYVAPMSNINGYIPLPYTGKAITVDTYEYSSDDTTTPDDYFSKIAIQYFIRIVDTCRDKNIKLYVCLSPALSVSKTSEGYLESLCDEFNVTCINMTHYITDPILFSDLSHLNDKGAEIFTDEIVRLIKQNNTK